MKDSPDGKLENSIKFRADINHVEDNHVSVFSEQRDDDGDPVVSLLLQRGLIERGMGPHDSIEERVCFSDVGVHALGVMLMSNSTSFPSSLRQCAHHDDGGKSKNLDSKQSDWGTQSLVSKTTLRFTKDGKLKASREPKRQRNRSHEDLCDGGECHPTFEAAMSQMKQEGLITESTDGSLVLTDLGREVHLGL
ncbi:expressed unknown protein [Seminavis robusta]|uniref:Uncharacterized protein n=1 Tax=Seminavis robusta TaxID=568900 RepID=A0A9N8DCH7_9STRA|nr:expressed unknown protein [Seminavis robusta]|eukprot:Sro57_g033150.1 n/a (193) ;mRNA; r:18730-19308